MQRLQKVARGALPGPGLCWLEEVGRQSPGGPLTGGSWLETGAQGCRWVAPHIAAGATWLQRPGRQDLGRRWSHLCSAVERREHEALRRDPREGWKWAGWALQPHLDVMQLGPVSCHDVMGASFF